MILNSEGEFVNVAKGRGTGVYASQTRAGRWQYRSGKGGRIIASGMPPAQFVREFWMRDDFKEGASA